MISVREHGDTTHLWFHDQGQTLATDSMPSAEAWQSVDGQWFQTLNLVQAAEDMALEYFEGKRFNLEWIGRGWRVTR